ncbi:MAG: family metallopeptidase [Rhodoglobus sp.]|nr:family metallopeptidase [Rhodoglobus sp.]
MTRRQARELENAAAARVPAKVVPAKAEYPRRSVATTSPKLVQVKRTVKRGKASTRPSTRRPGSSASSKFLSLGAMLFAAALLVGMSVPANAFISAESLSADASPLRVAQKEVLPAQSLAVSPDVASIAPIRDNYEVISYAQLLQLKYSGASYAYTATTGAVRWPFPYHVPITDGFGERVGGFHKGVDFVPGGGTPIYAIADGIASVAGEDYSGYGNHVIIQHDLGGVDVESLYAHMISGSSPIVQGQEVKVGDFLGLVGDTGVAYGAHLHFEIHINKVPIDPFAWLQANAVN